MPILKNKQATTWTDKCLRLLRITNSMTRLSPPAVDDAGQGQFRGVVEDHVTIRVGLVAAEAVDEDDLTVCDAYSNFTNLWSLNRKNIVSQEISG